MLTDERIAELWLELITHSQSNSDAKRRHLDAFARAVEREARREARREALEEAARVCDAEATIEGIAQRCAAAIRALIEKEQRT